MKISENLPFYSNTPDDTHCFQAGMKMILKYFIPDKDFSFEELDRISMKKERLWTWPMAALIWMQENGCNVISIGAFDYQKFADEGVNYIFQEFGKEVGETQEKHSNIEQERRLSRMFLEKVKVELRLPKKEDIFRLMEEGYVIAINVNAMALDGEKGYAGHLVIIKGYDNENFILNDPGLPGKENKVVAFDIFEKAWAYPNEKAKNIMAFKLNRK
jgi:hypothetical protein